MRERFYLNFETMPKATAQQKGYNHYTGHVYKRKRVADAEAQFISALLPYKPEQPSQKPIHLHLWLYFNVRDKKLWGKPKVSRPDVDNYSKAFIDQMTKCGFFIDDSQIINLHIEKFYAEKACIVVEWGEVEE